MKKPSIYYSNHYRNNPSFREVYSYYMNAFTQYKKFMWVSFLTNFKASYRQSFFGIIWKIILPLVPVVVYVVLQLLGLLRQNSSMPSALYVVIGMTFWQLFASSILTIMSSSIKDRAVLKKNKLPFILFYISSLGETVFEYFIRLFLILVLLIYYNVDFSVSWLTLPLLCVPIILLGTGLGILLSFFNVFFSDIRNFVDILLRYGIFISGVIFPLSFGGTFTKILSWNPMYILLDNFRDFLVFGHIVNTNHLLVTFALIFVLLFFSFKKLYSLEHVLREYL